MELQTGDVFQYHFLWSEQHKRGETSGRKKRPTCVTVTIANPDRPEDAAVYLCPITTKRPALNATHIEVPDTEARRANLTIQPCYIILNEINKDYPARSYVLEDREPQGRFSAKFMSDLRQILITQFDDVQITPRA